MYKTNRIMIDAEADVFTWKIAQLKWLEKVTDKNAEKYRVESLWWPERKKNLKGHRDGEWPYRHQAGILTLTAAVQCNGELKRIHESITVWDDEDEGINYDITPVHVWSSLFNQLWYWLNSPSNSLADNVKKFIEYKFINPDKSYPFYALAEGKE